MKKKMKKTFSLWLCVLLFAAGLPLGAQAASFYDVPSNAWYSQAVNSLADQGIVSGTGGGNYSPKATLTRAPLSPCWQRQPYPPQICRNTPFPALSAM